MSEIAKMAAGHKAAQFVENGMIVGLGTGSTAKYFIEKLIELRQKNSLRIRAVASSKASQQMAEIGGIEVLDINTVPRIDLTVDGADEIDTKKRMIKGGGGAHLKEKILAYNSHEMIVIVDESKLVEKLGKTKLPIEVLIFGSNATKMQIEKLGLHGRWRQNTDNTFFFTELGNLIFDVIFTSPIDNPEELHLKLKMIPGVVETGFFFNVASRVIIGKSDGSVEINI